MLAVWNIVLDGWAPSRKLVLSRVVSWALVIAITPTFVSKIFADQPIALIREDINERDRNDIDARFIAEGSQVLLVGT